MPIIKSPLGGIAGARTCTVYRLDPLGVAPLEPLIDIVPGLTPFRVTFDLIDSEGKTSTYDVTEFPVQFDADITTHVRKRLKGITITATLGAILPIMPQVGTGTIRPAVFGVIPVGGGEVFIPQTAPQPGSALRLDRIRLDNLESIADRLLPVMVVTPRIGLARAWFTSLSENWTPQLAESTTVSMSFKEVNIVSPLATVPDVDGVAPGNNAAAGGGTGAASQVEGGATASETPGVAPSSPASGGFSSAGIPAA